MPSSNFLLFDENKSNMQSDEEYSINTQRLNGVQSGIASSKLNNKFAYQVSLVAYAIAQAMQNNGMDALDTDTVSTFVNNFATTFMQTSVNKASAAEAASRQVENKYIEPKTLWPLMVSDDVAALLGVTKENPTVLDLFSNIAQQMMNIGTPEYIWNVLMYVPTIKYNSQSRDLVLLNYVTYSNSYTFDDKTGIFTLTNPQTAYTAFTVTDWSASKAVPVYFFMNTTKTPIASGQAPYVAYTTGDEDEDGDYVIYRNLWDAYTPATFVKYTLKSSNRNAYPDSGSTDSDGYPIVYNGEVSGLRMPRLQKTQYTGTGAYGQASPNSLQFDMLPWAVIITTNTNYTPAIFLRGQTEICTQGSGYNQSYIQVVWTEDTNTVSWYNTSAADKQLNSNNSVYHVLVLI